MTTPAAVALPAASSRGETASVWFSDAPLSMLALYLLASQGMLGDIRVLSLSETYFSLGPSGERC